MSRVMQVGGKVIPFNVLKPEVNVTAPYYEKYTKRCAEIVMEMDVQELDKVIDCMKSLKFDYDYSQLPEGLKNDIGVFLSLMKLSISPEHSILRLERVRNALKQYLNDI